MLFTGTPSQAVMNMLGYQKAEGNKNINSGKTYSFTYNELGYSGPSGVFVMFDQLVINGDDGSSISTGGVNGQYDRWCKNLSDINFKGRSDWRRVSKVELDSLYQDRGKMFEEYGWATSWSYGSSTVKEVHFWSMFLELGVFTTNHPRTVTYASCVSPP